MDDFSGDEVRKPNRLLGFMGRIKTFSSKEELPNGSNDEENSKGKRSVREKQKKPKQGTGVKDNLKNDKSALAFGGPDESSQEQVSEEYSTDNEDFALKVLTAANRCRKKHGVKKLRINKNMSLEAQERANSLASEKYLLDKNDEKYGANIYQTTFDRSHPKVKAHEIINAWYSEIANYNFEDEPEDFHDIRNATQLLWKDSKEIGVGKASSPSADIIFVIVYFNPPGNIKGEFAEQIRSFGQCTNQEDGSDSDLSYTSSDSDENKDHTNKSQKDTQKKKQKFLHQILGKIRKRGHSSSDHGKNKDQQNASYSGHRRHGKYVINKTNDDLDETEKKRESFYALTANELKQTRKALRNNSKVSGSETLEYPLKMDSKHFQGNDTLSPMFKTDEYPLEYRDTSENNVECIFLNKISWIENDLEDKINIDQVPSETNEETIFVDPANAQPKESELTRTHVTEKEYVQVQRRESGNSDSQERGIIETLHHEDNDISKVTNNSIKINPNAINSKEYFPAENRKEDMEESQNSDQTNSYSSSNSLSLSKDINNTKSFGNYQHVKPEEGCFSGSVSCSSNNESYFETKEKTPGTMTQIGENYEKQTSDNGNDLLSREEKTGADGVKGGVIEVLDKFHPTSTEVSHLGKCSDCKNVSLSEEENIGKENKSPVTELKGSIEICQIESLSENKEIHYNEKYDKHFSSEEKLEIKIPEIITDTPISTVQVQPDEPIQTKLGKSIWFHDKTDDTSSSDDDNKKDKPMANSKMLDEDNLKNSFESYPLKYILIKQTDETENCSLLDDKNHFKNIEGEDFETSKTRNIEKNECSTSFDDITDDSSTNDNDRKTVKNIVGEFTAVDENEKPSDKECIEDGNNSASRSKIEMGNDEQPNLRLSINKESKYNVNSVLSLTDEDNKEDKESKKEIIGAKKKIYINAQTLSSHDLGNIAFSEKIPDSFNNKCDNSSLENIDDTSTKIITGEPMTIRGFEKLDNPFREETNDKDLSEKSGENAKDTANDASLLMNEYGCQSSHAVLNTKLAAIYSKQSKESSSNDEENENSKCVKGGEKYESNFQFSGNNLERSKMIKNRDHYPSEGNELSSSSEDDNKNKINFQNENQNNERCAGQDYFEFEKKKNTCSFSEGEEVNEFQYNERMKESNNDENSIGVVSVKKIESKNSGLMIRLPGELVSHIDGEDNEPSLYDNNDSKSMKEIKDESSIFKGKIYIDKSPNTGLKSLGGLSEESSFYCGVKENTHELSNKNNETLDGIRNSPMATSDNESSKRESLESLPTFKDSTNTSGSCRHFFSGEYDIENKSKMKAELFLTLKEVCKYKSDKDSGGNTGESKNEEIYFTHKDKNIDDVGKDWNIRYKDVERNLSKSLQELDLQVSETEILNKSTPFAIYPNVYDSFDKNEEKNKNKTDNFSVITMNDRKIDSTVENHSTTILFPSLENSFKSVLKNYTSSDDEKDIQMEAKSIKRTSSSSSNCSDDEGDETCLKERVIKHKVRTKVLVKKSCKDKKLAKNTFSDCFPSRDNSPPSTLKEQGIEEKHSSLKRVSDYFDDDSSRKCSSEEEKEENSSEEEKEENSKIKNTYTINKLNTESSSDQETETNEKETEDKDNYKDLGNISKVSFLDKIKDIIKGGSNPTSGEEGEDIKRLTKEEAMIIRRLSIDQKSVEEKRDSIDLVEKSFMRGNLINLIERYIRRKNSSVSSDNTDKQKVKKSDQYRPKLSERNRERAICDSSSSTEDEIFSVPYKIKRKLCDFELDSDGTEDEAFRNKIKFRNMSNGTLAIELREAMKKLKHEREMESERDHNSENKSKIGEKLESIDFKKAILRFINLYRQKHRAEPVILEEQLSDLATKRAKNLSSGVFGSLPSDCGENIFTFSSPVYFSTDGAEFIVESWYRRIVYYNFESDVEAIDIRSGSFTQLVWRESKSVGISWYEDRRENMTVLVVVFSPAGNVKGHYKDQIHSANYESAAHVVPSN